MTLWGTALLIRAKAVEQHGPLNNDFFAYYEDTEICLRYHRAGYELELDCQSAVHHGPYEKPNEKPASIWYYFNIRNQFLFYHIQIKGLGYWLFLPYLLSHSLRKIGNAKRFGDTDLLTHALEGMAAGLCLQKGPKSSPKKWPLIGCKLLAAKPFFWARIFDLLDFKSKIGKF